MSKEVANPQNSAIDKDQDISNAALWTDKEMKSANAATASNDTSKEQDAEQKALGNYKEAAFGVYMPSNLLLRLQSILPLLPLMKVKMEFILVLVLLP